MYSRDRSDRIDSDRHRRRPAHNYENHNKPRDNTYHRGNNHDFERRNSRRESSPSHDSNSGYPRESHETSDFLNSWADHRGEPYSYSRPSRDRHRHYDGDNSASRRRDDGRYNERRYSDDARNAPPLLQQAPFYPGIQGAPQMFFNPAPVPPQQAMYFGPPVLRPGMYPVPMMGSGYPQPFTGGPWYYPAQDIERHRGTASTRKRPLLEAPSESGPSSCSGKDSEYPESERTPSPLTRNDVDCRRRDSWRSACDTPTSSQADIRSLSSPNPTEVCLEISSPSRRSLLESPEPSSQNSIIESRNGNISPAKSLLSSSSCRTPEVINGMVYSNGEVIGSRPEGVAGNTLLHRTRTETADETSYFSRFGSRSHSRSSDHTSSHRHRSPPAKEAHRHANGSGDQDSDNDCSPGRNERLHRRDSRSVRADHSTSSRRSADSQERRSRPSSSSNRVCSLSKTSHERPSNSKNTPRRQKYGELCSGSAENRKDSVLKISKPVTDLSKSKASEPGESRITSQLKDQPAQETAEETVPLPRSLKSKARRNRHRPTVTVSKGPRTVRENNLAKSTAPVEHPKDNRPPRAYQSELGPPDNPFSVMPRQPHDQQNGTPAQSAENECDLSSSNNNQPTLRSPKKRSSCNKAVLTKPAKRQFLFDFPKLKDKGASKEISVPEQNKAANAVESEPPSECSDESKRKISKNNPDKGDHGAANKSPTSTTSLNKDKLTSANPRELQNTNDNSRVKPSGSDFRSGFAKPREKIGELLKRSTDGQKENPAQLSVSLLHSAAPKVKDKSAPEMSNDTTDSQGENSPNSKPAAETVANGGPRLSPNSKPAETVANGGPRLILKVPKSIHQKSGNTIKENPKKSLPVKSPDKMQEDLPDDTMTKPLTSDELELCHLTALVFRDVNTMIQRETLRKGKLKKASQNNSTPKVPARDLAEGSSDSLSSSLENIRKKKRLSASVEDCSTADGNSFLSATNSLQKDFPLQISARHLTALDLAEYEITVKKKYRTECLVPNYALAEPKRLKAICPAKVLADLAKYMEGMTKASDKRKFLGVGKITPGDLVSFLKTGFDPSDKQLEQLLLSAVCSHSKKENFLGIVMLLIANGVNCDAVDDNGDAILKLAIQSGAYPMIDFLVQNSYACFLDERKNNRCHLAAATWLAQKCSWDVVVLVLENSSAEQLFTKNMDEKMAVSMLVSQAEFKCDHMEDLILAIGVKKLVEYEAESVLHIVAAHRRVDLVHFCLSRFPFVPEALDKCGRTVLHLFAAFANLDKNDMEKLSDMVQNLGVPMDIADHKQLTELQIAENAGNASLVEHWKLAKDGRFTLEPFCIFQDISHGMEPFPIRVINDKSQNKMTGFVYVRENIYLGENPTSKGTMHCPCPPGKCDAFTCPCLKRGLAYSATGTVVPGSCKGNPIFECGPLCPCGPSCASRVVQNGIRMPFEIFMTRNRGWGIRATRTIQPGEFVVEFVGEIVESDVLLSRDPDNDWAMELTVDTYDGVMYHVDPTHCGNVARFLNHSCDPNLFAARVYVSGDPTDTGVRMAMFSAQVIHKGKELTFDYGDEYWRRQNERGVHCQCGSMRKCKFMKKGGKKARGKNKNTKVVVEDPDLDDNNSCCTSEPSSGC